MMKKEINKNMPNPKQSVRRRHRGNTLVPVIIGIAISIFAAVTFLAQGNDLQDDAKRLTALNELSRHVSNAYSAGASSTYTVNGSNIYQGTVEKALGTLTYGTDNNGTCGILGGAISKDNDWVSGFECGTGSTLTITIQY